MKNEKPTTPGEVLQKYLDTYGINQSDFAEYICCDIKTINRLINDPPSK